MADRHPNGSESGNVLAGSARNRIAHTGGFQSLAFCPPDHPSIASRAP